MIQDGWTGRLGPAGYGGPQRVSSFRRPGIVGDWIVGSIGQPNVRIDFPVGQPGVSIPGTGIGVPPLVTTDRTGTTNDVPPPIDRRDQPLDEGNVEQLEVVDDWFEFYRLKNLGRRVLHRPSGTVWGGGPPSPPTPQETETTQPGGEDMDLGTLAGDLLRQAGTAYIQRELGPPTGYQPAFLDQLMPDVDIGVPGPGVFTPSAPAATCGGASPVYKKVCGQYKWVQPKRRRRKRLATQGDLKDLAALKGILGNGKSFEVWIATHC